VFYAWLHSFITNEFISKPSSCNRLTWTNLVKVCLNSCLCVCCACSVTKLKASLQLAPEQFEAQLCAMKPAKDGQNVVFYGFSSIKSIAAVEIAHKLGFKKYELKGFLYVWILWCHNCMFLHWDCLHILQFYFYHILEIKNTTDWRVIFWVTV